MNAARRGPGRSRHRHTTPALLAALAVLSGVTTACSSSASPVTLDVTAVWTGPEETNFTSILNGFANDRKSGTTVRYHSVRRDIGEELRERVEHGKTFDEGGVPDVAILPQTGTMTELATRKALVSVEDVAGSLVDRNYTPLWRELGTVGGTLYGVWFKANNKSVFWYRSQVFEDVRVSAPRSFEELVAVAKALGDAKVTPFSVGGGDAWNLTDWFENVYLRTAGAESYKQLACRQLPFTDRSVKEALTLMGQILGRRDWVAGGADAAFVTYEKSVEQVFGSPARAAMLLGGDYVASEATKYSNVHVGQEARFFEFPTIRGARPALELGGDVAVLMRDTPAGRDLIRFLATPQAAESWIKLGGFISPNRGLNPAVYPNEVFPLARAVREAGVANDARFDLSDQFPPSFGSTDGQGMYKIFQDWLRDPSSVEGTAVRLEEQASVVPKAPCR